MMSKAHFTVACCFLGAVLSLAGCAPHEEISVTVIPTKVPDELVQRDRMLGAIVPMGNNVWFYKLVADRVEASEVEEGFKQWVIDLAYESDEPVLDTPDRWTRVAPGQMQHAKYEIPVDGSSIQMSVARLGKFGEWEEQTTINVNRWRGQMGLESSEEKHGGAEVLAIKNPTSTDAALWVSVNGAFNPSPPMAGGSGMRAPVARQAPPDQPLDLAYDMPEGWTEGRSGGMRLAAFNVEGDSGKAEVTVIKAGGDIRQNIAMWLSQIKPESKPEDAVEELVNGSESITVIGKPGTRFRLFGNEDTDKAIDVAVIPLESGASLFIKMTGDRETVRSTSATFTEFLASIKNKEDA